MINEFYLILVIVLLLSWSFNFFQKKIIKYKSKLSDIDKKNNNNNEDPYNDIDNLPLIELHYHLSGGITVEIARKLAKIQNLENILPPSDEELRKLIVFDYDPNTPQKEGLNEYLKKFSFQSKLMETKLGIQQSIILQAEKLKNDGVVYAEFRFAPMRETLSQEEVIQAAIEALDHTAIPVNLILILLRWNNTKVIEANEELIELAGKYLVKDHGVVGLDLAGPEALFPTKNFEKLFSRVNELKIPFTIHAGENDDYTSVDSAISFGAKRIGHGEHARDNEKTMEMLKNKKITIEMCPTSNIHTHAINDIKDFPLRLFMEKGIPVTINTDNSAISNVTLKDEFKLLDKNFGLTKEEKKQLIQNSINAAFCGKETKQKLIELLNKY